MKTTLKIDDEIWGRARVEALNRLVPVGVIVEDALRAYLGNTRKGAASVKKVTSGESQLAGKSGVLNQSPDTEVTALERKSAWEVLSRGLPSLAAPLMEPEKTMTETELPKDTLVQPGITIWERCNKCMSIPCREPKCLCMCHGAYRQARGVEI